MDLVEGFKKLQISSASGSNSGYSSGSDSGSDISAPKCSPIKSLSRSQFDMEITLNNTAVSDMMNITFLGDKEGKMNRMGMLADYLRSNMERFAGYNLLGLYFLSQPIVLNPLVVALHHTIGMQYVGEVHKNVHLWGCTSLKFVTSTDVLKTIKDVDWMKELVNDVNRVFVLDGKKIWIVQENSLELCLNIKSEKDIVVAYLFLIEYLGDAFKVKAAKDLMSALNRAVFP